MDRLWLKDDTRNPSRLDQGPRLAAGGRQGPRVRLRAPSPPPRPATPPPRWPRSRRGRAPRGGLRARRGAAGQADPDAQLRRPGAAGRRHLRRRLRALAWRPARASAGTTATPPSTPSPSRARRPPPSRSPPPWRRSAPDVVVVPTGDGVITAGLAKGFADLEAARPHRARARVSSRSSPRARPRSPPRSRHGPDEIAPVPDAASVADSLTVEAPRNAILCLREVRASGGAGVIVSDDAIVAAIPAPRAPHRRLRRARRGRRPRRSRAALWPRDSSTATSASS